MSQVECPADGCDYTGLKQSVAAHYQAVTSKPDHEGGMSTAIDRIEARASESSPEPADSSPPESPQPDASNDPSPEQSSDPSDAMPSGETGPEASQSQDDTDDVVCPDDGGELVDFRDLTTGKYHKIQGQDVFVAGDFVCTECGEWWMDE